MTSKNTKPKQKRKVGRPPVELDELQISQVEALAAYLPIEKIADYLSISVSTFHDLKNKDDRISGAYRRGVAKSHAFAGSTLMKFMKYDAEEEPNQSQLQMKLQATIFYLKTRAGWSEKSDTPQDKNNQAGAKIIVKPNAKPKHRIDKKDE